VLQRESSYRRAPVVLNVKMAHLIGEVEIPRVALTINIAFTLSKEGVLRVPGSPISLSPLAQAPAAVHSLPR